jgi:thiamine-phosphate diphosphorylase
MTPVLCLITDRHRSPACHRSHPNDHAATQDVVARVRAAARAGVHLVQVRERDMDGRRLAELVRACLAAVRGAPARVLVNDRLDVALATGAHGVHLRAGSMPAGRVRRLAPRGFLIGRSVHNPDEANAASREGSVDYVIFGTVWPTSSKPGRAAAGIGALAAAVAASSLPVLAVGGVTEARAEDVARAGAAGIAAIGLFGDGDAGQAEWTARVQRVSAAWTAGAGSPDR